jgi:hypothetical protein
MKMKKLVQNEVFLKSLIDFLKQGAEEGDDLESTIVDVFSELYSDEPGPMLQRFAYHLVNNMQLKEVVGNTLLDHLHEVASRRDDVYDAIDRLQRRVRRIQCLPFSGISHPGHVAL